MTKGKAYILMQIKHLVTSKRGYDDDAADEFVKSHAEDTVYQLLVLKKELEDEEEIETFEPPSTRWYRGELRYCE